MTSVAAAPLAETSVEVAEVHAATEPPEARGLRRDEVRLMVAGAGPVRHALFRDLGRFLEAGDVLVVNTSATLPAAVDGVRSDGRAVTVHFSGPAPDGPGWIVELRSGGSRVHDGKRDERIALPGDVELHLTAAYPDPQLPVGSRLWSACLSGKQDVVGYLTDSGRPITYGYLHGLWPLASYQTVFAQSAGSAEMPSAGRPFSAELVTELVSAGVVIAPITLHTGVSSLEAGEAPLPEWFRVPGATARLVNAAHDAGSRVIAVGTTVARALETVAAGDGAVRSGEGWTDLVLGPDRPSTTLDGIITGWHEQSTSHLLLLRAVAGDATVQAAYASAVDEHYRWHEFGDAALLYRGRDT